LNQFFKEILIWAELWVLMFPIFAILKYPKQPRFMYPVIVFIFVTLWFNGLIHMVGIFFDSSLISYQNLLKVFKKLPGFNSFYTQLTPSHKTNTIFYNSLSLTRFICFVVFFFSLKNVTLKKFYYWIVGIFSMIFFLYFSFIDSFFNPRHISSDLMTGEAFFLLCFCLLYYLSILREEPQSFWARKDFWVVTGISFFSAINFFLFLFYLPLLEESVKNAINIWRIYDIAFIVFILFLTKAFYLPNAKSLNV
jgi:hypothetical protein